MSEVQLTKPMLAAKYEPEKAVFPMWASTKVDGIRCLIDNGVALSRSLKPIPNLYVQTWAFDNAEVLQGVDGELVIGPMTAKDCFRKTTSGVMSQDGEPDFKFWAFDLWNEPASHYAIRFEWLRERLCNIDRVRVLANITVESHEDATLFANTKEKEGHEGIMLRDPWGKYKMGRATVKQRQLLKLKSFVDAEAVILGFEEEMHNNNEATINEVGGTQRSQHKENMIGKGVLGALRVCLKDDPDVEFHIGTGFTAEERKQIWDEEPLGAIIKFKYFATGSKDKPRFPVFLGFRHEDDCA